jgi:hypothetical protein
MPDASYLNNYEILNNLIFGRKTLFCNFARQSEEWVIKFTFLLK